MGGSDRVWEGGIEYGREIAWKEGRGVRESV